jgi:U4/U6 small nuclear ribonucleoprotein PRP31
MDLADELMNDLAELDDETSAYREDGMDGDTADVAEGGGGMDVPDGGVRPAEELDVDEVEGLDMHKVADVAKIARLSTNSSFQDCLQVRATPLSA